MHLEKRKLVLGSFTLITAALILVIPYTTYIYFGIYKATRDFNVTIEKFNVKVFNASDASIEISLTLQNPSDYEFQVLSIRKIFYLDNDFILNEDTYMHATHISLPPRSNVTITYEPHVPSSRMPHLNKQAEKTWFVMIDVSLRGLLIGDFVLTFYEYPT